jgi:regulator of replication initiation timing
VGSAVADRQQRNAQRADDALNKQVSSITEQLDESMTELSSLALELPHIQTQVADIRAVYDSGRQKVHTDAPLSFTSDRNNMQAKYLVTDLAWLNTEFYERWRLIIFTSSSPVSWRWKALMRVFFAVSFVMFVWLSWITLWGGYRAHRGGLVWGERLMS